MCNAGTFDNIVLAAGETYRPLAPKKLIAVYKKGAIFGAADILHGQRRQSTVVSSAMGTLACIPRKEFLVRRCATAGRHSLAAVCPLSQAKVPNE